MLLAVAVVLASGGCGDKKKSDKNNSKSEYEGMTIKQLLEEEKFEIYGASVSDDNICTVNFTDGVGLYLFAEVKLSDKQMSEFENEFKHNTYKSYISSNLMDSKISNCMEQYVISDKEELHKLAEKGKAQKSEEMTGKSLLDLAEEGYTYASDVFQFEEYVIKLFDEDDNEWYIVTDVTGTEFEGGHFHGINESGDENNVLGSDVFYDKDERLKDVKIQEAYKMQ